MEREKERERVSVCTCWLVEYGGEGEKEESNIQTPFLELPLLLVVSGNI